MGDWGAGCGEWRWREGAAKTESPQSLPGAPGAVGGLRLNSQQVAGLLAQVWPQGKQQQAAGRFGTPAPFL